MSRSFADAGFYFQLVPVSYTLHKYLEWRKGHWDFPWKLVLLLQASISPLLLLRPVHVFLCLLLELFPEMEKLWLSQLLWDEWELWGWMIDMMVTRCLQRFASPHTAAKRRKKKKKPSSHLRVFTTEWVRSGKLLAEPWGGTDEWSERRLKWACGPPWSSGWVRAGVSQSGRATGLQLFLCEDKPACPHFVILPNIFSKEHQKSRGKAFFFFLFWWLSAAAGLFY